MQVVIDMPEAYYECLMNTSFVVNLDLWCKQSAKDKQQTNAIFALINALHSGTPLPEHYGDLIDRDKLQQDRYISDCVLVVNWLDIRNAKVIIPATKEGD